MWLVLAPPSARSSLVPEVVSQSHLWKHGNATMRTTLGDRLQVYASSLLGTGSFIWIPALSYLVYKKWHTLSRTSKVAIVLMFVALFAIRKVRRPWVRRLFLWDAWLKYLSTRIVFDSDPDNPDIVSGNAIVGRAIYAISPHGVFPFGLAMALVRGFVNVFGPLRPVAADVVFRVPFLGHLVNACGGVPARFTEMADVLLSGDRLAVSPGGVAEMFHSQVVGEHYQGRSERLVLASRTGMAAMALRTGSPVIPIYVFGASQVFKLLPASWLTEAVSRWARASLILFSGRLGLPVPRRVPLLFAVGRAVLPPAGMTPHPTARQVEELHAQIVAEFRHLYHRYKGVYDPAWKRRGLKIV